MYLKIRGNLDRTTHM